jgi:hypothetical protein
MRISIGSARQLTARCDTIIAASMRGGVRRPRRTGMTS